MRCDLEQYFSETTRFFLIKPSHSSFLLAHLFFQIAELRVCVKRYDQVQVAFDVAAMKSQLVEGSKPPIHRRNNSQQTTLMNSKTET